MHKQSQSICEDRRYYSVSVRLLVANGLFPRSIHNLSSIGRVARHCHTHVCVGSKDASIRSCYKHLGNLRLIILYRTVRDVWSVCEFQQKTFRGGCLLSVMYLFHGQDNTIRALYSNGRATILDRLLRIFDLKDASIRRECRTTVIVTSARTGHLSFSHTHNDQSMLCNPESTEEARFEKLLFLFPFGPRANVLVLLLPKFYKDRFASVDRFLFSHNKTLLLSRLTCIRNGSCSSRLSLQS